MDARRAHFAHLNVSACCVSMSVSVSASIVCTPGASARNDIRTDWHVAGRNGLSVSKSFSQTCKKKNTGHAPYTHATLQRQDPRSRAGPASSTMTLPSTPTFPNAHLKPTRPHALIKHKHIQRKFVPRHEPMRTTVHPNAHNDTLALRDCILRRGCGRAMRRRRR